MSRQIHELSAIVDSNVSGFESGIRKIASGVGKLADAWAKALSDIDRVVTRIGVAIGGLGAIVAKTGASFLGMQEQATISFTTMLGSAEKAKKMVAELVDFAAKTPFEMSGLLKSTQMLLAFGFQAEQVIPLLTAVGDAVAGLGGGPEQLQQTIRALGQIQAKGKASAEEMLQLAEVGIPAWQMLADKVGVSVPAAMKLVERGAIDANTTIAAVVEGMNARFGGLMQQQSRTFSGMLSTLKDNFAQASATVMEPAFKAITRGLAQINAFASSKEFERWVGSARQQVSELVESVKDALPAIKQFAMDAIEVGKAIFNWLKEHPRVVAFFAAFKVAQMLGVTQAILSLSSAILQTIGALANVSGAFSRLGGILMTDVSTPVIELAKRVGTFLADSWRTAGEAATRAATATVSAGGLIRAPIQFTEAVFRGASTAAEAFAGALLGRVQPAAISASAAIANIARQVALLGSQLSTALTGPVATAATNVQRLTSSMLALGATVTQTMQQFGQFGARLLTGPTDSILKANQAANVIDATFTKVGSTATSTGQSVAGLASTFMQWASTMAGQVATSLSSVTQKAWAAVTAANALKVALGALRIAVNIGPMIAMEVLMRKLSEETKKLDANLRKLSDAFQDRMDKTVREQQVFMREAARLWEAPADRAAVYQAKLKEVERGILNARGALKGSEKVLDEQMARGANTKDFEQQVQEDRSRLKNLEQFRDQLEDAMVAASDETKQAGRQAADAIQQGAPGAGKAFGDAALAALGGQGGVAGGPGDVDAEIAALGFGRKAKGKTDAQKVDEALDRQVEKGIDRRLDKDTSELQDFMLMPGVKPDQVEKFASSMKGATPEGAAHLSRQFGTAQAAGDQAAVGRLAEAFGQVLKETQERAAREKIATETTGKIGAEGAALAAQSGRFTGDVSRISQQAGQLGQQFGAGQISEEQFRVGAQALNQKLNELQSEFQQTTEATANLGVQLKDYQSTGQLSAQATQQFQMEIQSLNTAWQQGKITSEQYRQKLGEIAQQAQAVAQSSPAFQMQEFNNQLKMLQMSGRLTAQQADVFRRQMDLLKLSLDKGKISVAQFDQAMQQLSESVNRGASGLGGLGGGMGPGSGQFIGTPGKWFSEAGKTFARAFGADESAGGFSAPAPPPPPSPAEQLANMVRGRLQVSEPFKETLDALSSSLASGVEKIVSSGALRSFNTPLSSPMSDLSTGPHSALGADVKGPGRIDSRTILMEFPSITKLSQNEIQAIVDAIRVENQRQGRDW